MPRHLPPRRRVPYTRRHQPHVRRLALRIPPASLRQHIQHCRLWRLMVGSAWEGCLGEVASIDGMCMHSGACMQLPINAALMRCSEMQPELQPKTLDASPAWRGSENPCSAAARRQTCQGQCRWHPVAAGAAAHGTAHTWSGAWLQTAEGGRGTKGHTVCQAVTVVVHNLSLDHMQLKQGCSAHRKRHPPRSPGANPSIANNQVVHPGW